MHHIEAGLHDAERPRRQHRALVVEAAHQHVDAACRPRPSTFSAGTSQSSNTSSQVSEPRMPSLSSFCAVEKPLQALLDDEGGDAARAGGGIGLGVDDERVGVADRW